VAGMTLRGFPGPKPLVDDIIFAIEDLAVLGGFATQKTIAYLFHLVSSENMLQKSSSLMS